MPPDFSALRLTSRQLENCRDALRDAIHAGLAKRDQEVKALPAFLRRPERNISGRAVVLDLGGTHLRAAWIELDRGTARMLGPEGENALMERAAKTGIGRDEFFGAQADLVAATCPDRDLTIGYCFSYPADITPDVEAVLIEWTKGIRVADVVGQPVGKLLAAALAKRGRNVRRIPVMNDTIASLLAGTVLAPSDARTIGLIVGTGTNMAGFFPVRDIPKLSPAERAGWRDDEAMAVNLESGAFDPPGILTEWDHALDAALRPEERGIHRFEKAVSGTYLPMLLWQVAGREACLKAGFDIAEHENDAGAVVKLRSNPIVGEAATLIVDRSADLIAAGLAGLIATYGAGGRIGILVDGSVFHKTPGYAARVKAKLAALAPGAETEFIDADSNPVAPNYLGAASAALTRPNNRF